MPLQRELLLSYLLRGMDFFFSLPSLSRGRVLECAESRLQESWRSFVERKNVECVESQLQGDFFATILRRDNIRPSPNVSMADSVSMTHEFL